MKKMRVLGFSLSNCGERNRRARVLLRFLLGSRLPKNDCLKYFLN